jgi:hypothetical protein
VESRFDLFQGYNWATITAATAIGYFLPRLGRRYIRRPKRPSAALSGTGFVYLTQAAFVIKENAIAVGELDQAFANADQTNVTRFEFFHIYFETGRHSFDFGLVDPNIAGRPSAAIAATGALEMQTSMIPGP